MQHPQMLNVVLLQPTLDKLTLSHSLASQRQAISAQMQANKRAWAMWRLQAVPSLAPALPMTEMAPPTAWTPLLLAQARMNSLIPLLPESPAPSRRS